MRVALTVFRISFHRQAKPPAPPTSPNDSSSKVGQAVSPAIPMATINGRHLTLNKFPKTVKHSMRAVLLYPAGRPLFTPRNAGSKADVAGGGRRHYHITRNTMIPCQRPVPMSENDPRVPLNVPNEDGSVAL